MFNNNQSTMFSISFTTATFLSQALFDVFSQKVLNTNVFNGVYKKNIGLIAWSSHISTPHHPIKNHQSSIKFPSVAICSMFYIIYIIKKLLNLASWCLNFENSLHGEEILSMRLFIRQPSLLLFIRIFLVEVVLNIRCIICSTQLT